MAKYLKPAPKAKGYGVSDVVKDVTRVAKASIAYGDTTPILLFDLPAKPVLIKSLDLHVSSAFDASGTSAAATLTLTIPNSSGAQTLLDTNLTALQSTGFTPSTAMGITTSTGGSIQAAYVAGTTTAGAAEVYVTYTVIED